MEITTEILAITISTFTNVVVVVWRVGKLDERVKNNAHRLTRIEALQDSGQMRTRRNNE